MWPNAQISADLVTFMNKSFMENFIFCAVGKLFLFAKSLCPMSKRRTIHCVKSVHIRSFLVRITVKNIVISRDFLVWKFCGKAQFSQFWASRLKLCGNCAFPQNFQTRKSGEIMVFFAVYFPHSDWIWRDTRIQSECGKTRTRKPKNATAWKVFVFGVFPIRIFPHSDLI